MSLDAKTTQSLLDANQVLKLAADETLGALRTEIVSNFVPPIYDYVSLSQGSTTDVYTFKSGGSGGTAVGTITLTYTDSTKATLSTAART